MGVPPEMEIFFSTVATAIDNHAGYVSDKRRGIIVTPDVATMHRLVDGVQTISDVNVGGIHHRAGRTPRLRYVFLSADEERELSSISEHGVRVTAQDVPNARQVSIAELLASKQTEEKST